MTCRDSLSEQDPGGTGRPASRGADSHQVGASRRCARSGRRTLRAAILVLLSWTLCTPVEAADPALASLKKIRTWCTPEYTRVVLDLDRSVTFQVGRLGADRDSGLPERLYVDLLRTRCAGDLPRRIELDQGPVENIRTAAFRKGTGRMVLDLRRMERYKVFSLEDPDRIVVDLWWNREEEKAGEEASPQAARRDREEDRLPLIVLDPGHGGADPGAIGNKGLKEKDVVFAIARDLKRILEERDKARVVLTRKGDAYLSLKDRTRFANSMEADLFVSIHANASTHRTVRGIETYYLDNTTDRAAIRLAKLENRSEGGRIDDLHCILRDLRLSSNANESHILAQTLQRALTAGLRKKYSGIQDLGAKGNLFFVLLGAHMPSVLVEVSFISNPSEEKRLRSAAYQRNIAQGIADGIEAYLGQPTLYQLAAGPPPGVR